MAMMTSEQLEALQDQRKQLGKANQSRGLEWEREIRATFELYERAGVALLSELPPPTVPAPKIVRTGHGMPLWVRAGASPFSVYGIACRDGRFSAAELKASRDRKHLRIVLPDIKGGKVVQAKTATGGGIHLHQLEALARVAENGGVARIVWNNDGEVLVLREPGIINAWAQGEASWRSKIAGGRAAKGEGSIAAACFDAVDDVLYGDIAISPDWLGPME